VTLSFILLGVIAVLGIAAIVVGFLLDGSVRITGGPDADYFDAIGAEHADEEKAERRFRLAHLLGHMAVARIGRRPRP